MSALRCAVRCAMMAVLLGRPSSVLAADATAARRAAHLLGYVANDYAGAVRGGVVVNQTELDEQRALLKEAATAIAALPEARGVLVSVEKAQKIAEAKGDAQELVPLVLGASERLLALAGGASPPGRPSFERGREVFARACANCHGADGSTPTAQGAQLKPPPADLLDPRLVEELSPARIALAIEFGIPGTAMVPRADLSPVERWDAAFYAAALSFPPGEGPPVGPSFSLAEQATLANGEMRQALLAAGAPVERSESLMGLVRREIPSMEDPSLGAARAALHQARHADDEGVRAAAARAVEQIEGALSSGRHEAQRAALGGVCERLRRARSGADLEPLVDELYRLDSPPPASAVNGRSPGLLAAGGAVLAALLVFSLRKRLAGGR